MTMIYVDRANGNNAYDGLAAVYDGVHGPKATLNGAEDIPVAAGDLVHVRPGTYRETLTVDVAGTNGNQIEYRGDYAGLIWPSSRGQVVRITGSDNDQTAARNNCIINNESRGYRTFTGFQIDNSIQHGISINTNNCPNWIIQNCFFTCMGSAYSSIKVANISSTGWIIQNCVFLDGQSAVNGSIVSFHVGGQFPAWNVAIRNCMFFGGYEQIQIQGSGVTLTNNIHLYARVRAVNDNHSSGNACTVNNSIFYGCLVGLYSAHAAPNAEIVEDYNDFYGNSADRSNTPTGANSKTYPPLWESCWAFELIYNGAGPNSPAQMISPFDLSAASQLINLAGTSPTSTDMRGTGTIGGQREWGALEYDSTLKARGANVGGPIGSAIIQPVRVTS